MSTNPKTVALLVGGWSAERDVSLEKGVAVYEALRKAGYQVKRIDVKRDLQALLYELQNPVPDVVFNNLYGKWGEDGSIQAVLDILNIPYTHSGTLASAVGMDKPMAKRIAQHVGVKVPHGVVMRSEEIKAGAHLPVPFVVKPADEGSSVGVAIVTDPAQVQGLDLPANQSFLVEAFVPGRELTVAVLDGVAQGVTEIIAADGFFDYAAKYKSNETRYQFPAEIAEEIAQSAMIAAERVYTALGCRGLARCDFRYDDRILSEDGLYFLEINTQPGLTPQSIGPAQVVHNGLSFVDLCTHLVETATCRDHAAKHPQNAAPQGSGQTDDIQNTHRRLA